MAFSLYDATVANYLQILGAVGASLEESLAHFREKGVDPAEIVEARLAPDMLPLRFQIISVAHHSRGAWRRPRPECSSRHRANRASTTPRFRHW